MTRSVPDPLSDQIAGTLPYMAPETLRGARRRPTVDVWALGVVIHEMAAGRRPFSGPTPFELADGILNASPPPLPSSVPPAIGAVIARCLAKDPSQRYRTARDAQLALEPLAGPFGTDPNRVPVRRRIPYAITMLAIVAAAGVVGTYLWSNRAVDPPGTRQSIGSLMVLPFDNLSGNASEDYFADGMTDALTTDLSRLPGLKVISRTSAARFKALAKSSQEIGHDLGIDAIVEGSVLRAEDSVRISVRLVDAGTDRNLWARDYTRKIGDVLTLQADVARAIASEIGASFVPADQQRFATAAAVDPRALEEYLKGRHQWNRRTPSSVLQALAHFRRAVQLQPDYGYAHAGIAESLVLLPAFPISAVSPDEALPEAIASASRAIALDDRLASAHAALGYARLHALDPGRGEHDFRQALSVNPGYATAHFWYAAALASEERFDESIAEARRAETLDPVSPIIVSGVAWMHHLARRFDEEAKAARAALALDPNFLMAHYRLGEGLLHLGRTAEAVAALEKARALSEGSPDLSAAVAYAYGRAGRRNEARDLLRTLLSTKESKTRYISAYALALAYTGLDDRDNALNWLRRARAEQAWGMAFIDVEPDLDSLRKDPRFASLR
jgi:TolB-like protein/tetratricopeptide (TPR) repeat protein